MIKITRTTCREVGRAARKEKEKETKINNIEITVQTINEFYKGDARSVCVLSMIDYFNDVIIELRKEGE